MFVGFWLRLCTLIHALKNLENVPAHVLNQLRNWGNTVLVKQALSREECTKRMHEASWGWSFDFRKYCGCIIIITRNTRYLWFAWFRSRSTTSIKQKRKKPLINWAIYNSNEGFLLSVSGWGTYDYYPQNSYILASAV